MMCECGSPKKYDACCGVYHSNASVPPASAEALMRSRYSAYVRGLIEYVAKTQDFGDQPFDQVSAKAWSDEATWLSLTIVRTEAGGPDDAQGTVEFEARYLLKDRLETLTEASAFVKRGGRWIYLLETSRNNVDAAKVARNAPCPCGSGKKFKRCHGR